MVKALGLNITADDCICDGCLGERLGGYCRECPIRACNIERRFDHCGMCPDYICDNLSRFFGGSTKAKDRLEELRKARS